MTVSKSISFVFAWRINPHSFLTVILQDFRKINQIIRRLIHKQFINCCL